MAPFPFYPGYPPLSYLPYHPGMYFTYPEPTPRSPIPRPAVHLVSSPLRFEPDVGTDKLQEYFGWLMNGYPGKAQQLQDCLTTLRIEEVLFASLQDVPAELWKEWNVSI